MKITMGIQEHLVSIQKTHRVHFQQLQLIVLIILKKVE